jgi:transcriptional regulator with XRE-family HTH domain
MNPHSNDLAQRIRRCRQNLQESQSQFAKRFGVTPLAVGNWERGTPPRRKHLTHLTPLLEDSGHAQSESLTYQLQLPFEQPIDLELRISPQRADTIHLEVQLKSQVG